MSDRPEMDIDVLDRLTERVTRTRVEVEVRRSLRPLAVIAVGAAVGLACWLFILSNIGAGWFGEEHKVRFAVADATAVVAGRHDVEIKGVEVGTITKTELVGGRAVLTATIRGAHGKIYKDARAQLRPNTALQDMRLDIIDRGTAAAGEADPEHPIPARQTESSTNIETVLQAFDPRVRAHLRGLLTDLGGGLEDQGDALRETFVSITPFINAAVKLSDELAVRSSRTRRLVTNVATLTDELGRREALVRRLTRDGSATLTSLAAGSGDLERTLQQLPPTLDEVDRSFAALRGVLPAVDAAVVDLNPVAKELPGGLKAARALSVDADPALTALREPVRRLRPLARALSPFAADASRAVAALLPQVGAIDHATRTVADCTLGIYGFMHWTASVAKFIDARGVVPRGDAELSLSSATGGAAKDPNVHAARGCAPGTPKEATP